MDRRQLIRLQSSAFTPDGTLQVETYPLEFAVPTRRPDDAALYLHTSQEKVPLDNMKQYRWTKYRNGARLSAYEQSLLLVDHLGFNPDEIEAVKRESLADGGARSAWSTLTLGMCLDLEANAVVVTLVALTPHAKDFDTYALLAVCNGSWRRLLVFSAHSSPAAYWWPSLFNQPPSPGLFKGSYPATQEGLSTITTVFNKSHLNPSPLSILWNPNHIPAILEQH